MNQNTDRLSDETFAQQIIQGARSIQPDAAFASQLEETLMQATPSRKPRSSVQRVMRLIGSAAAVFVLLFIAAFNVPPLRAIAQELIDLLTRSTRDETTGYFVEQPSVQLFASLEKAQADLGRDFLVPHYFPSITRGDKVIPVKFQMLYYTPDTESVQISYSVTLNSRWGFSFMQTPSAVYYGQNGGTLVGASASIESVTFNFRGQPVSGQFVNGGWVPKMDVERPPVQMQRAGEAVSETATPPPLEMEWSKENGDMYLIWEADGIVYSFFTSASRFFDINRDELIRMAESIE